MTDDGFVFGDDADERDEQGDGDLFGARSTDERAPDDTGNRRFGTTAEDDSPGPVERVRTAVDGWIVKAAVVAVALVIVVALAAVVYPLVDGTVDTAGDSSSNGAGETAVTTERGVATAATVSRIAPTATHASGATATVTETGTSTTETTGAATTTTRTSSPTPTATATPRTTPVPTRGFPAGDSGNETG